MIDNWHIKIIDIVGLYTKNNQPIDETKKHNLVENIANMENMIVRLKDVKFNLDSIIIPPGKVSIHNELIRVVKSLRISFEKMIEAAKKEDMPMLEEANKDNEEANIIIKKFTERYLISET